VALRKIDVDGEDVVVATTQLEEEGAIRGKPFEAAAVYATFEEEAAFEGAFDREIGEAEAAGRFALFEEILKEKKTGIARPEGRTDNFPVRDSFPFLSGEFEQETSSLRLESQARNLPSGDQRCFQYFSEPGIFCAVFVEKSKT